MVEETTPNDVIVTHQRAKQNQDGVEDVKKRPKIKASSPMASTSSCEAEVLTNIALTENEQIDYDISQSSLFQEIESYIPLLFSKKILGNSEQDTKDQYLNPP